MQPKHIERAKQPQKKMRSSASKRLSKANGLTEEDIRRHMDSLVAIEDCTGARNFAEGIGAIELAQRTFDACVGLKRPAMKAAQASDSAEATVADAH